MGGVGIEDSSLPWKQKFTEWYPLIAQTNPEEFPLSQTKELVAQAPWLTTVSNMYMVTMCAHDGDSMCALYTESLPHFIDSDCNGGHLVNENHPISLYIGTFW